MKKLIILANKVVVCQGWKAWCQDQATNNHIKATVRKQTLMNDIAYFLNSDLFSPEPQLRVQFCLNIRYIFLHQFRHFLKACPGTHLIQHSLTDMLWLTHSRKIPQGIPRIGPNLDTPSQAYLEVDLIQKLPYWHVQMLVFWVILDSVRLTININYHTLEVPMIPRPKSSTLC